MAGRRRKVRNCRRAALNAADGNDDAADVADTAPAAIDPRGRSLKRFPLA